DHALCYLLSEKYRIKTSNTSASFEEELGRQSSVAARILDFLCQWSSGEIESNVDRILEFLICLHTEAIASSVLHVEQQLISLHFWISNEY
ncbi:17449_t:CDS:2, partial [Gigaspora margarita]